MHILKAELAASVGTRPCKNYRAAVLRGELGALIEVQQPIKGEWHGCGRWYLSTLLESINDGLSIDFGQNWNIDSGMVAAIDEALLFLANNYKTED